MIVKGFNQKKGIDFEDIFSLVVKMSSIIVVLGITASLDLEIHQLNVKIVFLHGELEEETYMNKSEGFGIDEVLPLVVHLQCHDISKMELIPTIRCVESRTQLPLALGFTLAHGHTRLVL